MAAAAQEEAKRAARDAAREAAALAASMGPTAAELKVRARTLGVDCRKPQGGFDMDGMHQPM